ncbi:hypothetical protein HNR12_000672 [Streptomonospora nanhaiensis]|uniref:Uncharacterized protein n=1 Tax=Streptomonospora nanhaiensis TaxID=1323731 RepID=A0A853BI32_9ACTN|nr:hypothetical protein [Streptomonospora nanhaiensis]
MNRRTPAPRTVGARAGTPAAEPPPDSATAGPAAALGSTPCPV